MLLCELCTHDERQGSLYEDDIVDFLLQPLDFLWVSLSEPGNSHIRKKLDLQINKYTKLCTEYVYVYMRKYVSSKA